MPVLKCAGRRGSRVPLHLYSGATKVECRGGPAWLLAGGSGAPPANSAGVKSKAPIPIGPSPRCDTAIGSVGRVRLERLVRDEEMERSG